MSKQVKGQAPENNSQPAKVEGQNLVPATILEKQVSPMWPKEERGELVSKGFQKRMLKCEEVNLSTFEGLTDEEKNLILGFANRGIALECTGPWFVAKLKERLPEVPENIKAPEHYVTHRKIAEEDWLAMDLSKPLSLLSLARWKQENGRQADPVKNLEKAISEVQRQLAEIITAPGFDLSDVSEETRSQLQALGAQRKALQGQLAALKASTPST